MFISLILEKLIFGEGIKWERFTRNATLAWLSFVSIHKSHVVKSKDTSPSEVCAATLGTNRCLWKFRVWKFLFKTRKRWSKLKKKFSYNLKASWFDWRRTTRLGQLFLVPRISPEWKFYWPLLRDIFSSPRGCCGERDNKYRVSDVFKVLIVRPNTDTRTISIYESFQAKAKPFSWL